MKEIFDFYGIKVDDNLCEKLHHRLSRYVMIQQPIAGKNEVKDFYELLAEDPSILEIKIKTVHGTFKFKEFKEILGIFDGALEDIRSKYVVIPPFKENKKGELISPRATKRKKELTLNKPHDFKHRIERIKSILIFDTGIKKSNRKLHPLIYDLMSKYWPLDFKEQGHPMDLQEDIDNRKTSAINSILKQKTPRF
jgi:hypothetical protein